MNTQCQQDCTALHCACEKGPLSIVQTLVAAGAGLFDISRSFGSPLLHASSYGEADIVAFFLQLPAVKQSVNNISRSLTALSWACYQGNAAVAQLLVNAGNDPTITHGYWAPLTATTRYGHTEIIQILQCAMSLCYNICKTRALLDADRIIRKAQQDSHDEGDAPAEQQQKATEAAPTWLKTRVNAHGTLPRG